MLDRTNWHQYTTDQWYKGQSKENQKPLTRADMDVLCRLAGTNEIINMKDIQKVYQPLAARIRLQYQMRDSSNKAPMIIGISGSVAVGKSTGARLISELLIRMQLNAILITTDNFLKPNHILETQSLLKRKGFPESYDQNAITRFLQCLKDGEPTFTIPTYDHIAYTILEGKQQVIHRPDILVLEGVNVLQANLFPLDYKIYFDAPPATIKQWYIDRFLTFRQRAFREPGAYFERFADLTDQQATKIASELWDTINLVNLNEHIAPSMESADFIIHKNASHRVSSLRQRSLTTTLASTKPLEPT